MKKRARAVERVGADCPGELAYHAFVPEQAAQAGRASLVVAVHGISRNALEQMAGFSSFAGERGHVLMAPCFDTPEDEDYQRLGRRGRGRRADLALDDAIRRLAEKTKIEFGHRFFFGYSGGGQFVHRYLLLTGAKRAERVIIANAGSYTLATDRPFPEGLGGTAANPATLREVFARPVVLQLGETDTDPQHSSLPRQDWAVAQGSHRFARGWFFLDAMRRAAAAQGAPFNWRVATVPGVGHSNAGMAAHAVSNLFGR